MSQLKKNQSQSQSAEDAPKALNKPYCCWVWSDKFKGYVCGPYNLYEGIHSLEQAIAFFDDLYPNRHYRIDQDDVVMFVRDVESEKQPQQLSLFDM